MDAVRVLIVDDESQFVETVVERLRLRGFDVDGVTSGQEAMDVLSSGTYDVALLDVRMPGFGGLEIVRKVREKWSGLRVVLLSGYGSSQDADEGRRLGAFEYLMKPVNIDYLASVLRAASESKTAKDE
jgi:two-component system, OmpR family, response regulator